MCLMFPWLFHDFLHASFLKTHSHNLRTAIANVNKKEFPLIHCDFLSGVGLP